MFRLPAWQVGCLFLLAGGGLAAGDDVRGAAPVISEPASLGETTYRTHCLGCHGERGNGDGPAAALLFPRPRDFVNQQFRLRSTPAQTPPSDADLMSVLIRGIPGSPMPGFRFLTVEERNAVIDYVKGLSPSLLLADKPRASTFDVPPPWTDKRSSIAAGKVVYKQLGCATCHGDQGRGDGPIADSLFDDRHSPIRPRDLVREPYKGGESVRDIYLRVSNGMDGTPMPAFTSASDQDRWHLAAYVASLIERDNKNSIAPTDDSYVIVSARVTGRLLANDPFSARWKTTPVTRVPVFPLISHRSPPPPLTVRSLHDERTIAFRLEWADATRNDRTSSVEAFADGVAIQWISGSNDTFLGMGSRTAPVQIWHWKADWQRDVDERKMHAPTAPPAAINVPYPFPVLSAFDAKNPYVYPERSSSVEEFTAVGFATQTPVQTQHTKGFGIWRDGVWYVVLSRDFDGNEVELARRSAIKLALAVWDGANRDRAGQKAVSSWYRLNIGGK